jgi:hypothetical protein
MTPDKKVKILATLGMAQRGQTGSTNSLRIETLI